MPLKKEIKYLGRTERGVDSWKNKKVGEKSWQGGTGGATLNYKQIQIISGNEIVGLGIPGINWVSDITAAPSLSGANINDQPPCPDGIGIGRDVGSNSLVWVKNSGYATNRFPLVAGTRIVSYTTENVVVDEDGNVSITTYIPSQVST